MSLLGLSPWFWLATGIAVYLLGRLAVIALGRAAAVGDEQLENEEL